MSLKLQDGTGRGYLTRVNHNNRMQTSATVHSTVHEHAFTNAETYLWTSSYSAGTGEEIIYIKNTSTTQVLVIEKIRVGSVNAGLFEIYEATGTAAGTSITGVNTNLTSGNVAEATSLGNASVTGISLGNRISIGRVAAASSISLELDASLILGLSDAIAITYTGSTGITDAAVLGYYATVEDL